MGLAEWELDKSWNSDSKENHITGFVRIAVVRGIIYPHNV